MSRVLEGISRITGGRPRIFSVFFDARLIDYVPDCFITRIGSAAGPLVTYAWDAAQAGKLAGFTDPSGSTAYRYDSNGRLIARTQTVGGLGFSVDYAWNPAGQLAQLTTPGGNRIGYAYAHGKINAITVNGQPLLITGDRPRIFSNNRGQTTDIFGIL